MLHLLGIDDTGRKDSADTPALALALGEKLESKGMARLLNISCHKLMKHPSIAYTSENICCCLLLEAEALQFREIDLYSREFLRSVPSPQANPGFALAVWNNINTSIVEWGVLAKFNVLERGDALGLARRNGISIAGFAGSGNGVIGALAAVGLRFEGSDGWLSWMPGLPALHGLYTVAQVAQSTAFDRIENDRGRKPQLEDHILIEDQVQPLLRSGKIVLAVKPAKRGAEYEWELAEKSIR